MNKRFIRVAVFCALTATAAPVFVGCSDDYDADIAGLQDQINKINGVVGITGDDMAAAIDEVVEQLQTKIDSLGGIVGDKVNVDELTASVNNLNQLIDQKADASQIQAEADRLQGLIEAANEAAAGANEELSQKLEQQISDLEKKQEEAQQKLNDALNGKVDPATLQAEAARLEGLINEAKKIAEGAVTSAQLDEKISAVEGEIESLESKLNSAATSEGVASQIEAAKQELQLLIDAKADPATIDEKIAAYNETLQATLDGKASATLVAGLRGEVTNLTGSVKDLQNELKRIDQLETSLGTALSDLSSVKSDLSGLKSRIDALEGADLNLSEYAEFKALANRVSDVEAKWGDLSSEDIDANTSAIADINSKLDAFFGEKADATVADIYNKLVALETWKNDIANDIASISSKADQSALNDALNQIDDLRTQLGLIGSQDPDEGEEGEEPTANFYNKEEIDSKFNSIKEEINKLVGTVPQSIVYMPNFDTATNQFTDGITFKSLFVEKLGTTPVATSAPENTIVRFRVSPASVVEKIKDGTYTVELGGKRMKSIPEGHITMSLVSNDNTKADEAEGIIAYQVNTGTLALNEAWALCVNLKKAEVTATADEEADKTVDIADKTDLTSNFFTLINQSVQIDGIEVTTNGAYTDGTTDQLAYAEHKGTAPHQIDYTKDRKVVGYLDGTEVVADLEKAFDLTGKLSIAYGITGGSEPDIFTTAGGVLTVVNDYSSYIGQTAVVTAQPSINGTKIPNKLGKYGTTYDEVQVVNILWVEEYSLLDNTKFTVNDGRSKTEWVNSARTFTLDKDEVDRLISETKIEREKFFGGLASTQQPASVYTDGTKKVTLSADPTNERIIVTYDKGVVVNGTPTLKLSLTRSDVSLPAIEIKVTLPTSTFGTLPNPAEDILTLDPGNTGIIWNAERTTTTLTPVPTTDDNITAMIWGADLSARFTSTEEFGSKYSDLVDEVRKLGGTVEWEALGQIKPSGISWNTLPNVNVNSAYSVDNAVHDLTFRINFKYGSHTITGNTYTMKVANISGKFVMPEAVKDKGIQFTNRTGSVKLSKDCKWVDATSAGQNTVWSEGKVISRDNGVANAVYGTSFFKLLNIGEPRFELVDPQYANFVNLNPVDGTFSLTPNGQTAFSTEPATVQVKVVINSRFGTIEGEEDNIINVHVNIAG